MEYTKTPYNSLRDFNSASRFRVEEIRPILEGIAKTDNDMFILRKFLHQNGSNYFLIIVLLEGSVVIYYETLISGNHGIQIKSSGEIAELALTPSTNLFDQGRDSDFDEFMANTKVDIARKIYGKLINKE